MGNIKGLILSLVFGLIYVALISKNFYSFLILTSFLLLYSTFGSTFFFFVFPFSFLISTFSILDASRIVSITAPIYFAFYKIQKSKQKNIFFRKSIHIALSLFLIIFFLSSKKDSLLFTFLIFLFGMFLLHLEIKDIFSLNFLKMDKKEFRENAFKAFWLFLSFLFLFSFFKEKVILLSSLVLCISDSVAVFGIYGKRKIHGEKTLLGSFMFFISSFLISVFFTQFFIAFFYSLIVTLVEAFSPIEDNFPIAFSSALFLSLFL
jgi:dolichol kinase